MGSFRKNLCNSLIGKALYAKKDFGHKKYLKKVIKKFGYINSLPYLCLRKHKQRVSTKFFDNTEKAKIESSKSTLKVARQRARVLRLAVQV